MVKPVFLHQLPDVKELFEITAKERNLLPGIIEKDYWLMHCLWGIQQQGFQFEMKGRTSLSRGIWFYSNNRVKKNESSRATTIT